MVSIRHWKQTKCLKVLFDLKKNMFYCKRDLRFMSSISFDYTHFYLCISQGVLDVRKYSLTHYRYSLMIHSIVCASVRVYWM